MQTSGSRDPYGTALGAVRRFADDGRFVPGEPIVVTELAAEVGLSATPVREALACLAGQGLIERRRGRGYFYPALDGSEIPSDSRRRRNPPDRPCWAGRSGNSRTDRRRRETLCGHRAVIDAVRRLR